MPIVDTNRTLMRRFIGAVRARPRLLLSIVFGCVAAVLLPADWRVPTRMLVGWDFGAALWLALALRLMSRSDVARIRRRAVLQDEGRTTILVLVAAAAFASLFAILAELGGAAGANRQPAHLALAAVTILLSWAFTHVIFALHYAP